MDAVEDLKNLVRDFIQREVIPLERQYDDPDLPYFPEDVTKQLQEKAKSLGLWCLASPAKYGGAELSIFAHAVVAEEAAKHRMGAYNPAGGAFGQDPPNIIFSGTEEQIQKYAVPAIQNGTATFVAITEPSGGSDPARAIQTRAERRGNKWVLNGRKVFISKVEKSKWGIVFARSLPDPGARGVTAFIVPVDAPGFHYRPIPVIRPWYPCEVILEDCEIPLENQLGEEGQGFALAQKWLVRQRIPYAAGVIGIAQAALEIAIQHARERVTFRTPLAEKQAVQWMIADSEVELRAARLLIWDGAWKADQGLDAKMEASIAKVYATETAWRVVDRCIQILGGLGVSKAMPLERWYRELRIKRIGEGPSEVHRMVIARNLLR